MFRSFKHFTVMIFLLGPSHLQADELPDFDFKNWTTGEQLESYRTNLYSTHLLCSSAAMERQLTGDEVQMCGEVYLELKLSFLNGVTSERYRHMSAKTRATAHDMGYAAYRAWLHRQIAGAGNQFKRID